MKHSKYIISYVVMDTLAGANPFHHAFLLLSKQEKANELLEVDASFGFYSRPSKSSNPLVNALWGALGLTFNLQGAHGALKEELMRELDGLGLKAKHFIVTKKQYLDIFHRCKTQIKQEKEAIEEQEAEHGKGILPKEVYFNEQKKALLERRKSRLQRFEFNLAFNFQEGVHTRNSYTCKTYALDILKNAGILNASECVIDAHPFGYAFPRALGEDFANLHLFSKGPMTPHYSERRDKTYYNRSWEKGSQLYFASNLTPLPKGKQVLIDEGLFALKTLDKRLRAPNNAFEESMLFEREDDFTQFYKRYAALSHLSSSFMVDELLNDTQNFLCMMNQQLTPLSPGFILASWEHLLTLSLSASILVVFSAVLGGMSGAMLLVSASSSTVATLHSGYGLFKAVKEEVKVEKAAIAFDVPFLVPDSMGMAKGA